ncbi:MAG: tetratricopeptide repeat protein [Sphaerochaetaceae bacterium]|nr:tetratricopeptide repeat protein [Sphaerochaetaceae bacterium]
MATKEELKAASLQLSSSNERDEAAMLIKYLGLKQLDEESLDNEFEYYMLQVAISPEAKDLGIEWAFHVINGSQYPDLLRILVACSLGKIYRDGTSLPKDLVKAKDLFEWACQFDYPKAMESLADFYYYGWATPVDYSRAFSLFLKSNALSSSLVSCFRLGDMYANGKGCSQDAETAFAFYQRAFRKWKEDGEDTRYKGDVALRMGTGYMQTKDYDKALEYFMQAIEGYTYQKEHGSTLVQAKLDCALRLKSLIAENINPSH